MWEWQSTLEAILPGLLILCIHLYHFITVSLSVINYLLRCKYHLLYSALGRCIFMILKYKNHFWFFDIIDNFGPFDYQVLRLFISIMFQFIAVLDICSKLWRITLPGLSIQKSLNIWPLLEFKYQVNSGLMTQLKQCSNTFEIDKYLPRGRVTQIWVTQIRSINFMTRLCLGLELDLVLFASRTNLQLGHSFAEIWFEVVSITKLKSSLKVMRRIPSSLDIQLKDSIHQTWMGAWQKAYANTS